MSSQTISIIIPMYNEASNLPPLYRELTATLKQLRNYRFEIIFVDDGSRDDSAGIAHKLARIDKRIRVLELSRNFGKEPAMTAGLHAAHGDAALIMDADLQMPPRLISQFLANWEAGNEVVIGVFAGRNTSFLHQLGSQSFYRIMQTIAHTEITPQATDYRLLDRKVINEFNRLTEHNRITRGLIDWLGFRRSFIQFKQEPRHSGKPAYTFSKLINLAVHSFTAYSLIPLKLAGYLGVAILALSLPAGLFMTACRFVYHWQIHGTAFLALLVIALVGIVLACLGLISLYIAHIHAEVSNRPLYIVRREGQAEAWNDEQRHQLPTELEEIENV